MPKAKKLRLLVVADVSPIEGHGGSVRVIREQYRRLVERGHDCLVLCRAPWDGAPSQTQVDGVPVEHYRVKRKHPLTFFLSSIIGARRAGSRLLTQGHWDAIIFHQPLSAFGLGPLAARMAIPSAYVHFSLAGVEYQLRKGNGQPGWNDTLVVPLLRWVERSALKRSTLIVVLSDFSRRELLIHHGPIAKEIVKIPGGVDLERFRPAKDRKALRERLGLPSEGLLLLTVRDLVYRMGLDSLILAMEKVSTQITATLVIGGTGELRVPLEDLTRRLGIDSVVRFAGHIPEEDLPAYYQAADLFVLPTRALEGFGLVTAEALACGTPVLGTPVGATPEILLPIHPGLVTEDASAPAIAQGVLRFANEMTETSLRERCRRHTETHYSWEQVVDALERTVVELVTR
jgi:glycosyltransferase involved in cell wall biosynthesis